jgi:hypothetical protein
MIITDRFVMLNYPKTGSSFTREILKQIHHTYDSAPSKVLKKLGLMNKPPMTELMVSKGRGITNSQHGNYSQIPEEHRQKKLVSVVRNPLQRYISEYLYGWWKKNPDAFRAEIDQGFQHFPDLSFQEYYELISRSARSESGLDIGYETTRFIKFYFRNPKEVLGKLDAAYIESRRYRDDMPDVAFLRQENLNNELFEFLLGIGYPEKDIAFIKSAQRINVTHRERDQLAVRDFFTEQMKEDVRKRDQLLFALFPEYAEELN